MAMETISGTNLPIICGCETLTVETCKQFGRCGSCGAHTHWKYRGGFGRGPMREICTECGDNHTQDFGYGLKTLREAHERQLRLIAQGASLADVGDCGYDDLPCGTCPECEENEVLCPGVAGELSCLQPTISPSSSYCEIHKFLGEAGEGMTNH